MADKVRYLLPDKGVLDSATLVVSLVASTESSGLPPRNVQDEHIRKVYRGSSDRLSEYLRYRFAAATTLNTLFIGKHNFTKNAIVLWQGNTTSNFATPALSYQIGVATDSRGNVISHLAYFWSTVPTSYAHWRLHIKDSGNATTNLEVGRIMGGRYDEPTRDIRDGFTRELVDPSRITKTAGQQGYPNVKRKYTQITYRVGGMSELMDDTMYGVYNEVGTSTPFVLALNPETEPIKETYYGMFEGNLRRVHRVGAFHDLEPLTFSEKL